MTAAPAYITAIKDRIESQSTPWVQGLAVHYGAPPADAQTPYVCIWDQAPKPIREKQAGRAQRSRLSFQLSCVSRAREDVLEVVRVARCVLDWAPVTNASPIVEDGSNPILTEGSGIDVRYTAPLTMHCYLP